MSDFTEALLADGPDLEEPEARERFTIDSDELAGWALRKLDALEGEQARIAHEADREIVRLQAWKQRECAAVQHNIDFFRSHLIAYRRRLEAANPKLAATYKLPWGSLTRRKGRESTKVVNADEFVSWALDNIPEALKYEPRVSALADLPRKDLGDRTVIVAGGGQIVPGVEVVTGDDVYDAKPFTAEPF